ncbi:acidic mammalian chitinase-like [Scylla paramamosain]|uniref:acidic mammalian chitinase-like n=1 Tax=Scylla paramamosain TaxID=85552 RepID=UPI0030831808
MWKPLLLLLSVSTLPLIEGAVLCYFESWAVYRIGDGKVEISELEPALCTHYIYAFAGINADFTIRVLDPWADLCDGGGKCGYDKFTAMKNTDPSLLTLLAVGGWNDGSVLYSKMAETAETRAVFIKSAIQLLKLHNFDGLDFCWTYPTQNGGAPEDRVNYVHLLRELKEALEAEGMVLTISVSPSKSIINEAYDVPAIAQHVDLVSVTTYDLHGPWDHYTHHHSGLYAFSEDTGDNLFLNVDAVISYWVAEGMPANKLVMGVPMFGRCWTLDSVDTHGYYAPASLPGEAGPWTSTKGFMAYAEICMKQAKEGWTVAVEEGCNEPYTYHLSSNKIWCSYENHDSVIIKGQYAADHGLGGVMVWSVNDDDAHGVCGGRKYDLTFTLADTFNKASN